MNNNLILVTGKTATGKSLSLRNLSPQAGVVYLNCENNKALPFRSKFKSLNVTDPYDIYEAFEQAEEMDDVHTIVIDTVTYMMDMYEGQYVLNSSNTQKAWGDYAQFFKRLMQQYVANSTKRIIMLAHTADIQNEAEMSIDTMVKVKGSLMNQGIESYFTQVVSTKKVPIKKLEPFEEGNALLNITERERALGFKYVFQTLITKDTVNERMRAPFGMWEDQETFIDNDIELVLQRIAEFNED